VGGQGAGVGGAGQAGQNGGLGGAPGAGGTTVASCSGCNSNQVCVNGACTNVPSQCPCPVESYCDLGTSKCVIGCTSNDECSTGRACNTTTRMCLDGCRDDTSCAAGSICDNFVCHAGCRADAACGAGNICDNAVCRAGCRVQSDCATGYVCLNTVCEVGCATTSDCTATGQTCTNNTCTCPASQMACNNACTPLNTVQNCGSCGNACAKNYVCTTGQCTCPAGTCQAQTMYMTTASIGKLWVDATYIYTLERPSSGSPTFQRVPIAGGAAQLIATVPTGESLSQSQVANGHLVFSTYGTDSLSDVPFNKFYTVPGSGGTLIHMEEVDEPFTSPYFGTDGTVAYWWDYNMYNTTTATLMKGTLSTGGYTNVATYYDGYFDDFFIQGSTLYMPRNGSNSSVGPANEYDIYTYTGSTTLGTLFYNTTATYGSITLDTMGFYTSETDDTTSMQHLVYTPMTGKNPVTLAMEGGRQLATDSTQLYYMSADGKSIRRVSKMTSGTPQSFITDGPPSYFAVSGGYVYYVQGTQTVKRLATTFQP
jgi:hypothetical protein